MDDPHDRIPGYLGAMVAYGATILTTAAVARSRGKDLPDGYTAADLADRKSVV